MFEATSKLIKILLASVPLITLAGFAFAQTAPPPPEDMEKHRETRIVVSAKAQEIAQDYADVLEELDDLTLDYGQVLVQLRTSSVDMQKKLLTKLGARLAGGMYRDNIEVLASDLKETSRKLRKREQDLRTSDRKAYRVTKSLRRDLEALRVVLLHDVSESLSQKDMLRREVTICLQENHLELAKMMAELREELQVLGDSVVLVELHQDIPDIPDVPDIPQTLDLPFHSNDTSPVYPPSSFDTLSVYRTQQSMNDVITSRLYGKGSGTIGAIKELADSVLVSSTPVPQ